MDSPGYRVWQRFVILTSSPSRPYTELFTHGLPLLSAKCAGLCLNNKNGNPMLALIR